MLDTLLRQALLLLQPVGLAWMGLLILAVVLWRKRLRGCASAAAVLAIVLTVVCFNLLGDAARDALDPRLRS